jgi:choline dehydrogenase
LGTVLLIECGSKPTSRHLKVPVEYPLAFHGRYAWQQTTVPQSSLANRRIPLPAGRTLGGSSAINAMIYLRGHATDFASWEQLLGSDWSSRSALAAFDAIESKMGIRDFPKPDLHPAMSEFIEAAAMGMGIEQHDRFFEPTLGIGAFARCQSNGRRCSAWDLWMKRHPSDSIDGTRIQLATNASVQHLVFDREKVIGVSLVHLDVPGSASFVGARKGVICCAGAFQSPRLLMESGIGDRAELLALGLDCRCDLPNVGKNLQDHLVFPVVRSLKRHRALPSRMGSAERYEYALARSGPLASNIAEVGGFFRFPSGPSSLRGTSSLGEVAPDFQWHATPTHYLEYPNRSTSTAAMSVAVNLSRPASRGSVRVVPTENSGSEARFNLAIDPAYLSESDDLSSLLQAVQWTRAQLESGPMSELVGCELLPGLKRQSDEQLAKAIARYATTIYHYAGTCGMGSASTGVVDSRFKVHGIEGLWICDASAMPTLVSCNTQATVMMMAYRLAHWIGNSAASAFRG